MKRRILPAMGKKAVRRLKRRRSFIQRYQQLEEEESSETTAHQHSSKSLQEIADTAGSIVKSASKSGENRKDLGVSTGQPFSSRKTQSINSNKQADLLRRFTSEEEESLKNAFLTKKEGVVTYLKDSNINLKGSSFVRLQGDNWLDDELVNGFAGLVNARETRVRRDLPSATSDKIPRTYMVSSFLFTKLTQDVNSLKEGGVLRWTERAKIDIVNYEIILVPLHIHGNHWALCCVDLVRKEFIYLDPSYDSPRTGAIPAVKRWLRTEITEKKGKKTAASYNVLLWTERVNSYRTWKACDGSEHRSGSSARITTHYSSTPKQNDESSCGVFVLKFADCLSMGISIDFTQKDISVIRKSIGLHLLRGYLPLQM